MKKVNLYLIFIAIFSLISCVSSSYNKTDGIIDISNKSNDKE